MFVYFIQAGDGGPVKIGIASDPEKRLAEMQVGNHVELILLAVRPGSADLERRIHARLLPGLIRGEWFRADTDGLSDEVADAIHIESQLEVWGRGLCLQCGIRPVQPPRTKTCSDACRDARRVQTSREWKRARK